MFGIRKKTKELMHDPEKAMDYAEKKLTKGFTGFAARAFLGKDFTEEVNTGLAAGRDALEMQKAYQNPDLNGLPATAVVETIQDTGKLINFNPVVVMKLKVTPQYEPPYETTVEIIVSKIAVPRAGDTIHIKYAPADKSKIVIV